MAKKETRGGYRGFSTMSTTSNLAQTGEVDQNGEGEVSSIVKANTQFLTVERVKDNEDMARRLERLFNDCVQRNDVPTIEKMAMCLGVSRETMRYWKEAERSDPARSFILKKAYQAVHSIESDLALRGYIPQVVYIFRAKNYFGMSDNPQLNEPEVQDTMGDNDISAVIAKYSENLPTAATVTALEAEINHQSVEISPTMPSDYEPVDVDYTTMPSDYDTDD